MNNTKACTLEDLLGVLTDNLTSADLLAAKLKNTFADAFLNQRLRKGKTQNELAKELGVNQAVISKWESGEYNFTIEKLADIADLLDLDIDVSIRDYNEKSEIELLHECIDHQNKYIKMSYMSKINPKRNIVRQETRAQSEITIHSVEVGTTKEYCYRTEGTDNGKLCNWI